MNVRIVHGDITRQECDAIVNAANEWLMGGGGVDGAIHRAAGPELARACRALNGCRTGDAKITGGYRLSAKFVIHAVGPVWRGGGCHEDELLTSCYRRCYEIARERRIETIAFPAISTGIFGFPIERATRIARRETASVMRDPGTLKEVRFVCFDESVERVYLNEFADMTDVTS